MSYPDCNFCLMYNLRLSPIRNWLLRERLPSKLKRKEPKKEKWRKSNKKILS